MPAGPSPSARPKPVHAFKPTSGTALGILGLGAAALAVVLVALTEHSLTGLRTALVAALVGVLLWMALLRPRVSAYADTLLLRNMATDVSLPLASVDSVAVRHTFNAWVDGRRYSCAGIGRSTRGMLRARKSEAAGVGVGDYASFVESTVEDLARSARRDLVGDPPQVRRTWAVPELTALLVLAAALTLTFLL